MPCKVIHVAIALSVGSTQAAFAQRDTSANVLGYELPGMRDAVVRRGLPYREIPGARPLTMDVYRPASAGSERLPALVFVHGGLVAGQSGPVPTEWPAYRSWGRLAAAAGLAGVMFNHRLTTDENLSVASSDVSAAIAYVRAQSATLGIDPDRLCIAVYSAGGPLASVVMRERAPYVRCLVLFYPFLDIEHMRVASRFRPAHSPAHVDSLVPRYSPAHLVTVAPADLPPIFVAMAGQDQIPNLNDSIDRFIRAAMASRVDIDFALHRRGEHGFDQRNQDARTREILERVIAFVQLHVKR
jgi:acetyl esterase/lipase